MCVILFFFFYLWLECAQVERILCVAWSDERMFEAGVPFFSFFFFKVECGMAHQEGTRRACPARPFPWCLFWCGGLGLDRTKNRLRQHDGQRLSEGGRRRAVLCYLFIISLRFAVAYGFDVCTGGVPVSFAKTERRREFLLS